MEDPPSNSPLVCSAFQGLVDHPIGLSTAPALAQFVHCALTLTHICTYADTRHRVHWRLNRYFPQRTGVRMYLYTQESSVVLIITQCGNMVKGKLRYDHLTHVPSCFHVHLMTWWHYTGWFLDALGGESTN